MTAQAPNTDATKAPAQAPAAPPTDNKELNFRRQEQMYQRILAEKEAQMAQLQQQIQAKQNVKEDDDDDDDEPYVDKKKLNKTLSSFERKMEEKIEKKAEEKARNMIQSQIQNDWLSQNSDFDDVMQHAEKFASQHPALANSILKMPDSFERQQLVYNNIKTMGLHKPPEPTKSSIQDTVDAKRRSPYYQPTGIANAPYATGGDFSPSGQKNAYDQMQKLKSQLRI